MMEGSQWALAQALEQLGREWGKYQVPELRNEMDRLQVFLNINKLVADGALEVAMLREQSPTFCLLYCDVMLRDLSEVIPSGDDE